MEHLPNGRILSAELFSMLCNKPNDYWCNMKLTLFTLLIVATLSSVYANTWPRDKANQRNKLPYVVSCYWGTWAYYRPGGDGKFEAENINPHLCTHIQYGFMKLDNGNRIALYDPDLDIGDESWQSGLTWGHGMIRRMNELRKYNPNLVTLASIGGWNEGSDKYSQMVQSASSRATFVASCVEFLKKYEMDGLDLDWEYPAMKAVRDQDRTPGRDADKQDYVSLLKELRAAFEPYGFILSAAVSAGKPTIDRAYDVPAVSKYLDLINLMTYDFHGGWDNHTAHNSPLYPLPGATGIEKEFTMSFAVDYWLKLGADPKKIVLGMPLYGRTFTLKGSEDGIGAPVTGKGGSPGPITRIIGMLGYNEICAMVKGGWKEHWNETQKVPYATSASQWIGYDNIKSIKIKTEFLIEKKLGGGMIWSIDTDDFSGHCGDGKYPLLKTISRMLNKVDGPDENIPRTHATTPHPGGDPETPAPTSAPVTKEPVTKGPNPDTPAPHTDKPDPSGKFKCTAAGFFADPSDKHKFHQCVNFGGVLKDYEFSCPDKAVYDAALHICKNE